MAVRKARRSGPKPKAQPAASVSLARWDMGATGPAKPEKAITPFKASKETPSAHHLREMFDYNPDTGALTWKPAQASRYKDGQKMSAQGKADMFNARYAGKEFGAVNKEGYRCGAISGKAFKAHRLIFKIMMGREPTGQVDHINGACDDNRWVNLREVDQSENAKNQRVRSNNKTGVMGVSWHSASKKWRAAISVNSKKVHVGYYDDFADAVAARKLAEARAGYHGNHGRVKDALSDLGFTTELARRDMHIEDVAHFDEKTGKFIKSPNQEKRARRVDMLQVWERNGSISTAGYNAACKLRAAYEATERTPGWSESERVDSSPKPDLATAMRVDRISAFHAVYRYVHRDDVAVIDACVLSGRTPAAAGYHAARYKAGLAHLRDALDRLARALGS